MDDLDKELREVTDKAIRDAKRMEPYARWFVYLTFLLVGIAIGKLI